MKRYVLAVVAALGLPASTAPATLALPLPPQAIAACLLAAARAPGDNTCPSTTP